MNIQLLSDLHLEFYPDDGKRFVEGLDPTHVDVLVLAGDISLVSGNRLRRALEWFCAKYPQVVFILGNHEFYRHGVDGVLEATAEIAEALPNLHWLENSTVEIDGQRFVGSSLWFPDLPDGQNHSYARSLNDFRMILGFREWVYGRNTESQKFLEDTVQAGDVVVTHHIPTVEGVHPKWLSDVSGFGRFFLCQLPKEVLGRPRLWFYGHTHDSIAFEVGNCQFRCNPFGYYMREENPEFNKRLVFGGDE